MKIQEKTVFNMIGGGFQHDVCSCGFQVPKHVIWDKIHHNGDISIHIDSAVFNTPIDTSKYNIAWFAESPAFTRCWTEYLDIPDIKKQLFDAYSLVVSCDMELIERHTEVKYVIPTSLPWIQIPDMYSKTKNISIIASSKRKTPGQQLRHQIIDVYGSELDIFGREYNPIKTKDDGLIPYRFSFAIENISVKGYFSEKIADCFATSTIPIYYGDPEIGRYFNTDGIVFLDDYFNIKMLTKELYNSKIDAIKENLNIIQNWECPEDYIYKNYIEGRNL